MLKIKIKDFNLDYTLNSGQEFKFKKIGNCQKGVLGDFVVELRQDQNALFFECHPNTKKGIEKDIIEYFNLKIDLEDILTKIDTDSYIHRAITNYHGLRIITQDPWECLVSYIISQRKRIPSIKKNIEIFSRTFGKRIWLDNYSFPSCESVLKKCVDLKKCRLGYREPYILETVSKIVAEKIDLEALKDMASGDARDFLKTFHGVGDKIADCVLLYALKRYETFPVDTWIRKVMIKEYIKKEVSDNYIRDFAKNRWGGYAGYAQIYLFYYSRMHLVDSR